MAPWPLAACWEITRPSSRTVHEIGRPSLVEATMENREPLWSCTPNEWGGVITAPANVPPSLDV